MGVLWLCTPQRTMQVKASWVKALVVHDHRRLSYTWSPFMGLATQPLRNLVSEAFRIWEAAAGVHVQGVSRVVFKMSQRQRVLLTQGAF